MATCVGEAGCGAGVWRRGGEGGRRPRERWTWGGVVGATAPTVDAAAVATEAKAVVLATAKAAAHNRGKK